MANNRKDFYSEEEVNKRAKEHNCDGICYTSKSMCPRAEICSETRVKEFWATVFSVVIYLLLFNPIAWIVWICIINIYLIK